MGAPPGVRRFLWRCGLGSRPQLVLEWLRAPLALPPLAVSTPIWPSLLPWLGWTHSCDWDVWPRVFSTFGAPWSTGFSWILTVRPWLLRAHCCCSLSPSFSTIFNDKCSYAETHILSLAFSLTRSNRKIVCLLVYLTLFCLSGALHPLSVFCYRCSSWRPSTSVCFIVDFFPSPLFFSLFLSVPFHVLFLRFLLPSPIPVHSSIISTRMITRIIK